MAAHQKAAISAMVALKGISEEEATRIITGRKKREPTPEWLSYVLSNYRDLGTYKTVGLNGYNPLSMRDLKLWEEDNFKLEWWEKEFLFAIDNEVMVFNSKSE